MMLAWIRMVKLEVLRSGHIVDVCHILHGM